jgi:beta-lactamase regulating signal transducer with metallopeptidase domain
MSWLTDTLIATGALIAAVLVLRRPVSRWFGPGMAYALWALPLLRLIIPPLVLPEKQAPVTYVIAEADAAVQAVATVAPAQPGWAIAEIALAVWLAGALTFIAWRAWGYVAMRRRLLSDARPVGEIGRIRLVETPAAPSPVAFGLADKVVALPPGFMASEDRTARDLAIAHELEHHAGRDIAVNFAMQPLLALHWFNPLAWLGWRALRRDQEAACDARVLEGRSAETRAAYGRLIANFAQGPRLPLATPLACPVVGEKSIIHRLRSLTMDQPTPRRRLIGRLLIGAGALALPLTASISYAASSAETPEPPAPPAAPEAPAAPDAKISKKIIIVDHADGASPDDPKLHTRTIERNGKTIILKTSEPLSDAEVEEKIAKAEASMADAEAMAEAGNNGTRSVVIVKHGDGKDGEKTAISRSETRAVIMTRAGHGDGPGTAIAIDGDAPEAIACAGGGEASNVSAQDDKDGKRQVVNMRFCSHGGSQAMALAAIKKARDKMSTDSELSGEIRTKVLEALDREIERLSRTS